MTTPRQVRDARVVDARPVGAYTALTVAATGMGAEAEPGHFVAFAVGGAGSPMLLRRSFSLAGWDTDHVEVVVGVAGTGTAWLAARRPGDTVDVVGPLGQPFRLPAASLPAVVVGGGYGAAPLVRLAEALTDAGCAVHAVLGAASADRLLGVADIKADTVTVTTDDGTAGRRGRVSEALPEVLRGHGAGLVYSCGPMPMLAAVAGIATAYGVPSQVAVEESMACGVGVCMTCVLPVTGDDGMTRMLRACTDGPVFGGDRVRFEAVGTVPAGTWGGPR